MTSPAATRSRIQTEVNAANPRAGRQVVMLYALALAAQAMQDAGIEWPASVGTGRYLDQANIQAAAQASEAAGEPGHYLGRHDGMIYTPEQMIATLHRYLLALGWSTTSTQPAAPGTADAAPIFKPATWRAALDQNGLAGSHTTLTGTDARNPVTIPIGRVVDLAAYRVPGGRVGKAYAANVPAGASKIETQSSYAVAGFTEIWNGFSFQLSRSFPLERDYFHTIARLRMADDSQPAGLGIWRGKLWLCARPVNPTSHLWALELGEVQRQVWHDVAWMYRLSIVSTLNYYSVYLDGRPKAVKYSPGVAVLATGTSPLPSLRYGLYRDSRCPGEACVYHMGWAIGSSMGSVMLPGSG